MRRLGCRGIAAWACFAAGVGCLGAQEAGAARNLWSGKSGEYSIQWTASNLKVTQGERTVYDAAAAAKAAWADMVRKSNGIAMEAQFTYRLLSAVGPYLSVEEGVFCDCGGAHPTAVTRFRATDLRGAKKSDASLTAIFPEGAVYKALSTDGVVTKALGEDAKPKTWADLIDTLQDKTAKVKDCEYAFPEDIASRFAFYGYEAGNAAVRIGLPNASEVCRGQSTQLGLTLAAPAGLKAELESAKAKRSGALMADVPKDAETKFSFSQKKK